jgi:hypothetical protein
MDDEILRAFMDAGLADAAVYLPAEGGDAVNCRVMIDKSVQAFGFESRTAARMTTLHALVSEVGTPRRRAVFVVGADRYSVDATLDADESIVTLAVAQELTCP